MSTSLTGLSTNFFPSAQNGFTTTLASTISSGATTVPLNSVAGYTNGQIAVFVVDPSDATKKQTFTGVIDTAGVQVTSVVWTAGTNQAHSGGATVVDYATATHISMVTKGITQQHSQAGAHTAVTATSLAATGNISTSAGNISATAGTINAATVSSLQDTSVALSTYRSESQFPFTASGGVWTGDALGSTRAASMTAWVGYINGQRGTISAVTARTFTASKDTYIDILNTAGVFTLVYTEVANNAASPALAANSMRIGIIVTAAGSIAAAGSINQGEPAASIPTVSSANLSVVDSLGNLIYNTAPSPTLIGYRQATSNITTTSSTQPAALSLPVIVPAGRKVKLTLYAGDCKDSGGSGGTSTFIFEGATQLQRSIFFPLAANVEVSNTCEAVVKPSTGTHTYIAQFNEVGGVGTATYTASTTAPVYFKAELI